MNRQRRRAEDFWWEPSFAPTTPGSIHDLGQIDGPTGRPIVLWLPDPEQRHGWREKYVYPDEPKGEKAVMGFRPRAKDE